MGSFVKKRIIVHFVAMGLVLHGFVWIEIKIFYVLFKSSPNCLINGFF